MPPRDHSHADLFWSFSASGELRIDIFFYCFLLPINYILLWKLATWFLSTWFADAHPFCSLAFREWKWTFLWWYSFLLTHFFWKNCFIKKWSCKFLQPKNTKRMQHTVRLSIHVTYARCKAGRGSRGWGDPSIFC